MYATVADFRSEGVTAAVAADARLSALIDEATRFIDRVCGWWFEPRSVSMTLSGRGLRTLTLPVPPVTITALEVDNEVYSVEAEDLKVIGNPMAGPACTLKHTDVIRRGRDNVTVEGTFGFVEQGTNGPRVPLAIRRACMLLVLDRLPKVGSPEASDSFDRWRVLEERTRDQSIVFADRPAGATSLTGNLEVDQLLAAYVRPPQFGAA